MTPAIDIAKKHKITYTIHEYTHEPNGEAYGLEAAKKLAVEADRVFKTLVVITEKKSLAVAIIPVAYKLNLKALAKALGVKKVAMALPKDVERSTGYILGGVSPLGQKKSLMTVIDQSANTYPSIYVSAGKRGLEIELAASGLASLTRATLADIKTV